MKMMNLTKSMKLTNLAIAISVFCSCNNGLQQAGKSNVSDEIKGDWADAAGRTGGRHSQTFFSFRETGSLSPNSWSNFFPWSLQKDTLVIQDTTSYNKGQLYKYAVQKLTNDSLVLLPVVAEGDPQPAIRLYKLKEKNNVTPTSISFMSGMCFGTCPAMSLTIDAQRNISFYGDRYTSLAGGYRGKLSEKDYQEILNKVHALPIETLKPNYKAGYTDAQSTGVEIQYGGKTVRSIVYGSSDEPVELRVLLNNLMSVYKQAELKPDSTVKSLGWELGGM